MVKNLMFGVAVALGLGAFVLSPATPAKAGVGVTIGVPGVYIHAGDRHRHRYYRDRYHHRYYGHSRYGDRYSLGPSKRVCKTKYTDSGYKRVCKTKW